MKNNLIDMSELATLLQIHKEEITLDWANRVLQLRDSRYQQYPLEKIIRWMSQGLEAITKSFKSGSNQALEEYLTEISTSRLDEGFKIYEVTEALLLAKEAILSVIWRSATKDSSDLINYIIQIDVCMRYMVGYFGLLFSDIAHQHLLDETKKRLIESESIKRTMAALLQKLNLDEVLEIVCTEAKNLTKATGSAVILREDDWLMVTFSIGNPLPALDRLSIDNSLAGLVIQQGQPLLLNDLENQIQAYHRNPDLLSLLVIPLFLEDTSVGVIDVVNKPGGFTNDDIRIMSFFADQAAMAIEKTRLHKQAEQLAVVNERQRLARDLHDSLTQTMYSLALYTEATQKALQGKKIKKALDYLDELQKIVREVMLDMRLLIFELHPPILQKDGLATALKTRLESVESRSGIHTEYKVINERRLPLEIEAELYRIVQEALTNVVKHSKADRVSLSIYYYQNKFKLKVQDNGIGFDIEQVSTSSGLGLKSIQERVKRMNGTITIESSPQTGTTLEATIEI